ncbi:hypothetical protein HYN56_16490 [Flavobacterium crocinum]|uniref:Lantibiotic dehydratase N-terminal domain-containing protein n=1 Tax=Flavobacterium crocinum TaxID=2183896 RepID=A0A2S1YPK4_9FLAO|nr:lantibiotic dehydratase family protein [Flavobacterium crocinum]AWK05748.1 hypothetical protein HYN56_16490 [Flavobacterium crocinum]
MNNKFPYKNFPSYILRAPLLSFTEFEKLTRDFEINNDELKKLCNSSVVKEAIFLASVPLYKEMEKWLGGLDMPQKKVEKLKESLLKYISRMCSRCTPFGLFAGVAVGKFEDISEIEFNEPQFNGRTTRLDMNYLVWLSQKIAVIHDIKRELKYFPNNSIYRVGNKIRYIEYNYLNNKRLHQISEVDCTNYLDEIINRATEGVLLNDLVLILCKYGAEKNQATEFIEELIKNQLLFSELEPSISGPDMLKQILSVLEKMDKAEFTTEKLRQIRLSLNRLDRKFFNDIKSYQDLKKLIEDFIGNPIGDENLLQTDFLLKPVRNTLDTKVIKSIFKAFTILNKLTPVHENSTLSQFKHAFIRRYGDREVNLTHALDNEIGIGYVQNGFNADINPLLDNLSFFKKQNKGNVNWTNIQLYFVTLIQKVNNEQNIIKLTKNDFNDLEVDWNDFADTVSFCVEVIYEDGISKIKLGHGASLGAADMLGRFSHLGDELESYVKEVIKVESNLKKEYTIAEVVHLPESRVGNVLMRPDFREFEIPYLARSIKETEKQIKIEDLMVSVKDDSLVLRCRRTNRFIFPRLTTAHNYAANSLPIYHFLSDFKNQDTRYGVNLDLNPLHTIFDFIPRIEYEEIILHEASWLIKKEHIEETFDMENNDEAVFNYVKKLRTKFNLPKFVLLNEGNSKILVNLENINSIKILLNIVKSKESFQISEFLYKKDSIVRRNKEKFTNEIIIGLYKDQS